jgi:hypothetical protein
MLPASFTIRRSGTIRRKEFYLLGEDTFTTCPLGGALELVFRDLAATMRQSA